MPQVQGLGACWVGQGHPCPSRTRTDLCTLVRTWDEQLYPTVDRCRRWIQQPRTQIRTMMRATRSTGTAVPRRPVKGLTASAQEHETVRLLAIKCSVKARATTITRDGNVSKHWSAAAGRMLTNELAVLPATHWRPEDCSRYCTAWYRKGYVRDAPRPGRPPKLPEFVVASCLNTVVELAPRTQAEMNKSPEPQALGPARRPLQRTFSPCIIRPNARGHINC